MVGLPETFRLGLVVGGLGSGKSSLARVAHQAFGVEPQPMDPLRWAPDKAVVSGIGASPDASVAALQSCGLSAVPALLRPFSSLSGGERTKSELALRVHAHHTVFDDFGATVSRDAASSAAAGVAKLLAKSDVVKRTLRRVVFTSFPEVGGYLGADWVLCLETNTLVIRAGGGPALGPTIVIDDSELEITTAPPERRSEGNDVKELKTSVRVDEWVRPLRGPRAPQALLVALGRRANKVRARAQGPRAPHRLRRLRRDGIEGRRVVRRGRSRQAPRQVRRGEANAPKGGLHVVPRGWGVLGRGLGVVP